jgi:C-terminal processing protease CtpA/Prc
MNPDGPAARTGQLQLRDTITRVGHVSFVGIEHQQAVKVLQEAVST